MTYSLGRDLFVENGPAEKAAAVAASRPAARFLPWRKLDSEHRFQAIQEALNAANDVDNLPLAL